MANFFDQGFHAETPSRKTQHIRRSSSSSGSLLSMSHWPKATMLGSLLLWTTLILAFMLFLSLLLPVRHANWIQHARVAHACNCNHNWAEYAFKQLH